MSDVTQNDTTVKAEVTTEVKVPVAAVKPVYPQIDIHAVAAQIAILNPEFMPQKNKNTLCAWISTVADEDLNWKKGPNFVVMGYAGGITMELWNYGMKKGIYLSEFKDTIKALVGQKILETYEITFKELYTGGRIRIKIPNVVGVDEASKIANEFIKFVNPTVVEIRSKVQLPEAAPKKPVKVVSTKETSEAPAAQTKTVAKSKSKKTPPAVAVAVPAADVTLPAELTAPDA